MRCQKQLCPYDTDQDIDATEAATTKIALLDLHDRQVHPPAPLQPQGAQPVAPQQNTQWVCPLGWAEKRKSCQIILDRVNSVSTHKTKASKNLKG